MPAVEKPNCRKVQYINRIPANTLVGGNRAYIGNNGCTGAQSSDIHVHEPLRKSLKLYCVAAKEPNELVYRTQNEQARNSGLVSKTDQQAVQKTMPEVGPVVPLIGILILS